MAKQTNEYDLIIVGGGPAAMSASLYAARRKLNTKIITKNLGGQVLLTTVIENWLGEKSISGKELFRKFEDHFNQYNLPVEREEVSEIFKKGKGFEIIAGKKRFSTKSIIITAGRASKKLGVPGEDRFYGKGISTCVTCDAPIFSGKDVAVIGTGDTATNAVLFLAQYAKKIYLISKYDHLKGDQIKVDKVKKLEKEKKVEVLYGAKTTEVVGGKFISDIRVEHKGKIRKIAIQGIFVEIGMIPETEFIDLVDKNEKGEIIVGNHGETNVPGIFAAGDCTNVPHKQIIIAAGDGAKAAMSAAKYLESL